MCNETRTDPFAIVGGSRIHPPFSDMQYDVTAEAKALVILKIDEGDAMSPEEAAADAFGGARQAEREAFQAKVRNAMRGALDQVLREHKVPFAIAQVDFSLQAVGWGGDTLGYDEYADAVTECSDCEAVILERDVPGQPYTYGFGDEECREPLCYRCRERRKGSEPKPTEKQLEIIRHALGLNYKEKPFRNHYCTTDKDPELEEMVTAGWFKRGILINEKRDRYYHVTAAGRGFAGVPTPEPTAE